MDAVTNPNLGALCQASLENLEHSHLTLANSPRPRIADFSRVTLCKTSWPHSFYHAAHQDGIDKLGRTMQRLRQSLDNIQAEDMPFAMVAGLLNTRF